MSDRDTELVGQLLAASEKYFASLVVMTKLAAVGSMADNTAAREHARAQLLFAIDEIATYVRERQAEGGKRR